MNNIKVVAIAGEPATGKTTLMKKFMCGLPFVLERTAIPLVTVMRYENYHVLGIYDDTGETFQGTDRLSMAVQPKAEEFLESLPDGSVVLFEGDRLCNNKFLSFLAERLTPDQLMVLFLSASETILEERHEDRGDNQTKQFQQSRKTKVANMRSNMDLLDYKHLYSNENLSQTELILDHIDKFLGK